LLGYWSLDDFTFLEHLAILPTHRNKGIGGGVIELAKKQLAPFLLECEPPETEIAARRLAFYRRCGLLQNDHPYIQPSYRENEEGVPLILMSYPTLLTNIEATVRAVYASAYGKDAL
jgi:GNAT superfamily N-acetyltransferase